MLAFGQHERRLDHQRPQLDHRQQRHLEERIRSNAQQLRRNEKRESLQNLGLLNNAGSFANVNLLQIGSGGVLNNSGSITNVLAGQVAVESGGTFNNSGSFLSDYLSSFGSQAGSAVEHRLDVARRQHGRD